MVCSYETLIEFIRRYTREDSSCFSSPRSLPLLICTRIAQHRGLDMKGKVGWARCDPSASGLREGAHDKGSVISYLSCF